MPGKLGREWPCWWNVGKGPLPGGGGGRLLCCGDWAGLAEDGLAGERARVEAVKKEMKAR